MAATKKTASIDPAELTFFQNLFTSVAEEMGVTLARTAYSPNIKERRDFSCAVFDAKGRLTAQAAHIPVHLGAMPLSVEAAMRKFPVMRPGDAVILNDPFKGGTHLPDITIVTPVFLTSKISRGKKRDGKTPKPLAYLATRAHHADVGGMSPGSLPLSREIYQEGLRLPPLMLHAAGAPNQAIVDILLANCRTPRERLGDLRAQLAAHAVGEIRLAEAFTRYGAAPLAARMDALLGYGERLMRALLRRLPPGEYRFEDWLDADGIAPEPLPIRVKVTISRGGRAVIDFEGTAPQTAGPLNAVEAITRSAAYYCFLCLLATPSALHGATPPADPPLNAGCFAPLRVLAPPGSLVAARPPAAVAAGNVETSQRIVDTVFGALAQAAPGVIPAASQGTMNNLTLGGWDSRRDAPFTYYETIGGGMGARPGRPGLSGVHTHMTNTLNTPIEALESAYPLRVLRYELRDEGDSPPARQGIIPGGRGVRRDLQALAPCAGALLTERRQRAPWGLHGAPDGSPGENALIHADGRVEPLPSHSPLDLKTGDVISIQTPGGGAWKKPPQP